ncbi:LADA_0C11848g1_1 [Lachancea dasiensis]|uniref:Mediator of RNA polymerase II transcription subunit 14 n=1 Tax=Lachancea dasiensis TaxID=1072105 RepID=A0A1G4J2C2_9SACH|nr:LADA_0C11848g1_1 [Lachancea dasiensis]
MTTAVEMLQNNGLASPERHNSTVGNGLKSSEKLGNNIHTGTNKDMDNDSQHYGNSSVSKAPELPHVEVNQLPIALLIRNLTVFSVKELVQFLKTSVHEGQDTSVKKTSFLQLVIFLRNQFLKIYVLVKWCRTIKNNNFNTMIDLLNWFRGSNMAVNNCIWALKASLAGMLNAKLPNPDLVTALEVLSLGRPNLPTHSFSLSGEEESEKGPKGFSVPSKLILKKLRDMNIIMSVKVSLMELPDQFKQYTVRDGRLVIHVENEFEVQLSTTDQRSPLFFVDLKLLFNELLPLNKYKLEKVINEVLFKSPRPLFALYRLLHNYVLSVQMYILHAELLDLESNSKYSGGNLKHHYDSRKNGITLKYWLHSRLKGKCNAIIGVDKESGNITLKWNIEDLPEGNPLVPVRYSNVLNNLGNILDEIMFNHSQIIKSQLLSTEVLHEEEDISDALLFHVPSTPASVIPIQIKINPISGIFYAKNPSGLLTYYINQINKTTTTDDFVKVLNRLKLDKTISILKNMFEKVGWVCNNVIKLNAPISIESTGTQKMLSRDLYIRLQNWPANWYLILSVISSNASCALEKRIGKITASNGNWELKYLDTKNVATLKLESMTYQKVIHLKKTSLHSIIDHMIIDSLNGLHMRNKICAGDSLDAVPEYIFQDNSSNQTSVLSIELESFLGGPNALNNLLEKTMFLRIDYQENKIKLFGKFKHNSKMICNQYNEALMQFIDKDSLSFFMTETFIDLNNIVQHFNPFKQKLMQIVTLTDVIERLHNFYSENFSIVALKPNEISFKYLKHSNDEYDCLIHIQTTDHSVENLDVKLSPSNPQYIIQPFIESSKQDYKFVFNYLQFTSGFFGVVESILSTAGRNSSQASNGYSTLALQLHNLSEYELIYYNAEVNSKITLMIELRNVFLNGSQRLRYYVHFADDEHISSKSPAYPLVHRVRNTVFMVDNSSLVNSDTISSLGSPKKPKIASAIRLTDGICCDATDIELVIKEINSILRVNSI